ncbi:MAG TPA: hypothetical protein VE011_09695 [Candidatus Dormibacteraeota bacterium]|nr:hypothetical protein [Candidatus Dormibacteraeota bacterium]
MTGVASGNLGTGTALDDTQVYAVDALTTVQPEPAPSAPAVPALAPAAPATAPASPATATVPAMPPAPARAAAERVRGRSVTTGGYPVGILATAVAVLLVVAAVLVMRGGGLASGGRLGSGAAGAQSFPPMPSVGAVTTAAPLPTSGPEARGKHHGHGHGGGD